MVLMIRKNPQFFVLRLSGLQNDLWELRWPFSIFLVFLKSLKGIRIKNYQIPEKLHSLRIFGKILPKLAIVEYKTHQKVLEINTRPSYNRENTVFDFLNHSECFHSKLCSMHTLFRFVPKQVWKYYMKWTDNGKFPLELENEQ